MIMAMMLAMVQGADVPVGRWTNPSGSVIIMIEPCGAAFCGKVDWASDKAKADARRGGTASLVGTQLMTGFKPAGNARWRGRLFIPDMKYHSKAELMMAGPDTLKVTGCMVARMICKSQHWTRVN